MVISQTPLRISLCGGGTDFKDYYKINGGLVISSAIDKFIYVIVKERFDDLIYINYSIKEIVDNVDEIKHGLVREAMRKTGLCNGVEITILADIPSEGSGLGSSSSLTVGLLNAFYNYLGKQVCAEQLASEACEIEIDLLKKPIGKQDQYIAAYGGLKTFCFCKDDSVIVSELSLNANLKRKLGSNLLLFFTNLTRQASSVLNEQKSLITQNKNYLDEIKKLAVTTAEELQNGNIDFLGEALHKNWELKKKLASNISNDKIDEMYNLALSSGASGGKIAGAGGGGFLLLYCKQNNQDKLKESMNNFKELPFMLEPHGSKIIFNYTRNYWK